MSESNPTLAEVFRVALEANRRDTHTSIPAKVVKVHRDGDRLIAVDVQPLVKASYVDAEGDTRVEAFPVVPRCPVAFQAAGGFSLVFPVAAGNTGILVFSEASIDKWFAYGGTVDPGIYHRHSLTDGMFIPGVREKGWATVPTDRARLGSESGDGVIEILDDEIRVGQGEANEFFQAVTAEDAILITCSAGTVTHNLTRASALKAR